MAYNFAEYFTTKRLEDNLNGGSFVQKQPCSAQLLKRLRDGVRASDFTPKRILKRFR